MSRCSCCCQVWASWVSWSGDQVVISGRVFSPLRRKEQLLSSRHVLSFGWEETDGHGCSQTVSLPFSLLIPSADPSLSLSLLFHVSLARISSWSPCPTLLSPEKLTLGSDSCVTLRETLYAWSCCVMCSHHPSHPPGSSSFCFSLLSHPRDFLIYRPPQFPPLSRTPPGLGKPFKSLILELKSMGMHLNYYMGTWPPRK